MNYAAYGTLQNCDLSYAGKIGMEVDARAPIIAGNTH